MDTSEVGSRHEARERALQALYAIEMNDRTVAEVCEDLIHGSDKRYVGFSRELVLLTNGHRERLDKLISTKAEKWDIDRIAILDRITLRLAIAELLYIDDVPPKVTINEAIEVAKTFSTDQSGRFINGILDAIFTENELEIRRAKKDDIALTPPADKNRKKGQNRNKNKDKPSGS